MYKDRHNLHRGCPRQRCNESFAFHTEPRLLQRHQPYIEEIFLGCIERLEFSSRVLADKSLAV